MYFSSTSNPSINRPPTITTEVKNAKRSVALEPLNAVAEGRQSGEPDGGKTDTLVAGEKRLFRASEPLMHYFGNNSQTHGPQTNSSTSKLSSFSRRPLPCSHLPLELCFFCSFSIRRQLTGKKETSHADVQQLPQPLPETQTQIQTQTHDNN